MCLHIAHINYVCKTVKIIKIFPPKKKKNPNISAIYVSNHVRKAELSQSQSKTKYEPLYIYIYA